MSDFVQRINDIDLETKVWNVGELRYTPQGNAVCNARIKVATKFEDDWPAIWYELTAWGDAAEVLASCSHGDDVIVRDGRLKTKAYRTRDGEVKVEGAIHAGNLERVGSMVPSPPAPTEQIAPDDVPF